MTTLEKPRWEYGGTFDTAWAGTSVLTSARFSEHCYTTSRLIQESLAKAHVVTLDRDQYRALPSADDDLLDYEPDPHLPFPTLYVSISSSGDMAVGSSGMEFAGVVIGRTEDYVVAAIPFWFIPDLGIAIPTSTINMTKKTFGVILEADLLGREKGFSGDPWDEEDSAVIAWADMERAVRILRFLESSNVDLEDQPVSRQVRRHAARKGTPIAQRVYVRSPRHRRVNGGITAHIDFTHRFEVRGHYKHYGEDTMLFRATERDRPHKVIDHPTRGRLVRVWCPDFVKGPEDKPLVPKTRVYKKEER